MIKEKKNLKEYERITTVQCEGREIDIIRRLTSIPFDGGKGYISEIREHKKEKE